MSRLIRVVDLSRRGRSAAYGDGRGWAAAKSGQQSHNGAKSDGRRTGKDGEIEGGERTLFGARLRTNERAPCEWKVGSR